MVIRLSACIYGKKRKGHKKATRIYLRQKTDWELYFNSVVFHELSVLWVELFGDKVAFETTILLQVILENSSSWTWIESFLWSANILLTCMKSCFFTLSQKKLYIYDIVYCDSFSFSLSNNDHPALFHLPFSWSIFSLHLFSYYVSLKL